uniref:Thioredoxin domain-containing protein n=1 Tax=Oryctolagus cuniculus TaxID=9986 RepID=A0A5F9CF62_RABIT
MVEQVDCKSAFQEVLDTAGDKRVVGKFSAITGPKPFFYSLSEKYSNVFLEVDVDDCWDTAAECAVRCRPPPQVFKKRQKVGEFSGANKENVTGGGFTCYATAPAPKTV